MYSLCREFTFRCIEFCSKHCKHQH